jgi:threonyl-tRNA synthetase
MNDEQLSALRHTLAHLLAAAVHELYPHAKPTIGPAIDTGFYYDFDFAGGPKPGETDLAKIEQKMRELLKRWDDVVGEEVKESEARTRFAKNPYKLELISEILERNETLTLYHTMHEGKAVFTDLCRGGHMEHPATEIPSTCFRLDRTAGAYWRGDEKQAMLTRIYGLAFPDKASLVAYEHMREEAKKRDHKKLGRDLDLFYIDEEVGKGLPMWTPKGTAVKFALEEFTRNLERKYGYEHVSTPYLASKKLYETSGHLAHYSESMYTPIVMDDEVLYLRPMACPHHIKLLQRKPISYRDLPVRYAEIADYNRHEKSGELMGMIRVRKFQLTDAHVFVSPEGLKEEFMSVCRMIQEGMRGLGIAETVTYRFSKRDPKNKTKYYPDDKLWDRAEGVMKEALDELDLTYIEAEDEAAFYGPKLDVQARNVNGKEDTLFTAQMDFLLPEKFNIEYVAEDGTKRRPVMIHRSAIGCLERTFAFLIEHYGGAFPFWMAPVQVRVLPVGTMHHEYARKIYDTLVRSGYRAEIDDAETSLGKRIRNAKMDKLPYFIVIGDTEVANETVTLEGVTKEEHTLESLLTLFSVKRHPVQ